MAKSTGLGQSFYIGGYDLSGDVGSIDTAHGGPNALQITGINKSAIERIGGLLDGEIAFTSFYNTAASQEHAALSTLPTADVHAMWVTASTIGNPAACMVGKQMDYAGTRGGDGSMTFKIQVLANGNTGFDWCEMLTTGKRTDVAATNGASWDFGAVSSLFGMTAYLQVFSVTGTSITVTLEDSADNAAFASITAGAFAAATPAASPQAQRIQTATGATIRRYVRAVSSGTFNPATFAVAFHRHLTATL